MLTREANELLTHTGPGTPMGQLMRSYWLPALLSEELPEPDGRPSLGIPPAGDHIEGERTGGGHG